MSNPRQQVKKRPARRARQLATKAPPPHKSKVLLTVIPIAAIIVVAVVGVAYWYYVWPFQRVIIKVEGDSIRTNYFLKRLLIAPADSSTSGSSSSGGGADVWSVMQTVTEELIIKQEAPKMGIPPVTDQDISDALHSIAKGSNDTISDAEFNAWYRQTLNSTQLTDAEFRDIISKGLLRDRLNTLLQASVSTVGPQVHLYTILAPSYDDALKAKARIDDGEDFGVLAKELSLDSYSKDTGGEVGWLPPDALDEPFKSAIAALDIGVCSDPVNSSDPNAVQDPNNPDTTPPPYSIFWISEKSVSMPIADQYLSQLKARVLQDWVNNEMSAKQITFHGMRGGGFDSVTSAWLSYQVERLKKGMTGQTATSTDTSSGAAQGQ